MVSRRPHRQGRRAAEASGFVRTPPRPKTNRMILTGIAIAGLWAATANAADSDRPAGVTVRAVDKAQEVVTVPLGKSVVVDLAEPSIRVAIAAEEVATIEVLSPKQVLVTGKAVGTTRLSIWGEKGEQRILDVSVEVDLNQLRAAIRSTVPGANVEARAVLDAVVLTGTVPSAEAAQQVQQLAEVFSPKVRNQMKVAGLQQVLIRCTVAEVTKNAIRQLGINGWLAGENVRDFFGVNQIGGINPVNIGAAAGQNVMTPLAFVTDQNGLPLTPTPTLSLGFPRVQLQLFIQALRQNNLLRVLAEPNLVAIAGEEASFLAGGEIPVPVPQASGGGVTITIEWKEYGIRLRFTATPVGRDMIRLRVAPEVSELDPTTGTQIPVGGAVGFVPGIRQRRAETTIELATGSTIAIAGLLSDVARGTSQKIPGIGDVPVLGALFSSNQYRHDQSELVILVTPEIVSAMTPDQVPPIPGQNLTDPNDWELFGLGILEGKPVDEPDAREMAVKTDVTSRNRKWTAPPTQMSLHGPWGTAEEAEAQP